MRLLAEQGRGKGDLGAPGCREPPSLLCRQLGLRCFKGEREQSQFTWLISIIVAKIHNHVVLFIDHFILSCNLSRLRGSEERNKGSSGAVGLLLECTHLVSSPFSRLFSAQTNPESPSFRMSRGLNSYDITCLKERRHVAPV